MDDNDIVDAARKRWERDKSAWSEIYSKARDDLHFLSDDEFAQWDRNDAQARTTTGRPAITIDQLGQFIHQVANDIRMNTPTINVIPGDKESSVETAEALKGLIRNIEYSSNADDAYDTAALNAVKASFGFIRVDHEYVDDESFEQQLCIRRVTNPLACMLDSDSTECDGRDAKHGTILDTMKVSEFKRMYPDFEPVSFDGEGKKPLLNDQDITLAEHFVMVEEEKEFGQTDNGVVEVENGKEYKNRRKIKKKKIYRYKLSGADVLEKTTFPGKYIPLVPVYGEEHWIEGKRNLHSLIRKSKSAQRMYNYWKSLETELLMKAPKAHVMAPEGAVEDYTADWTDPDKAAVLRYRQTDASGQQLNKPERLPPPPIPTGIINAARETVDDIKATMGIYNASLGQRSNENSGVAINARKLEGDVATYHFGDNLVRSIAHVGRILVCAIPEIYDTPRILRIIGEEDEPKEIGVNGEMADKQEEPLDITKGKYDVKVVTGAAFSTKRQETVAALTQMFSANPELMTVFGDIFFKNSDFAGAQAMAKRAEKLLPAQLQEKEGEEQDPEKIQMAQTIEQLQTQMQELAQAAQSNQAQMQKVEIDGQKLQIDAQLKVKELEQKDRELDLKQAELQEKYALEDKKIQADLALARIEAKKVASPDMAMADPELYESGVAPMAQLMDNFTQAIVQSNQTTAMGLEQLSQIQAQSTQAIIQAVTAPKRTEVVRDEQGRITAGIQTV
jgi:hypothetical protein